MSEAPSPPLARRDIIIAAALLVGVFLVYGLSPNSTPFDSRWTVHTAMSVLRERNTNLDEYSPLLEATGFYMIECVTPDGGWKLIHSREECTSGKLYNFYAVAVPFLATPVIAVLRAGVSLAQPVLRPVADHIPSQVLAKFLRGDFIGASPVVELFVASLFGAATAVLMYFVAREYLDSSCSALLAAIFAFCTPTWSLASRALWQHGPSAMLVALVLLVVVRGGPSPGPVRFLGAPLAFSFFIRASNAVSALVFTVFVWRRHRGRFAAFLLSTVPVILFFDLYYLSTYGASLAPYSWVQREGAAGLSVHPRFFEALAGNLISPARGLIVYVPLALLSVYGMFLRPLNARAAALRPYLIAVIVMHWLLVSSFEDWIGGHSFGPRYMSDIMPFLLFFLIPVMEGVSRSFDARRWGLPVLAGILALVSFGIHFRGATHWPCWDWNATPVDINDAQWRVWDWRDPAFLR